MNIPEFRGAMYKAVFLGIACFFSPFGWGAFCRPLPIVNMLLSLALYVMVVIAGLRTLQSWAGMATLLRWPMLLLSIVLIVVMVIVGCYSLGMQQTSLHEQWIVHKTIVLIALGVLSGFILQEVIWKKMERKQLTMPSTVT